jgi:hypothetical protein
MIRNFVLRVHSANVLTTKEQSDITMACGQAMAPVGGSTAAPVSAPSHP